MTTDDSIDALYAELRRERSRLVDLIERAERSLSTRDRQSGTMPASIQSESAPQSAEVEPSAGRRGFLRLAGAAAAGVGLSAVVARPALAVGEVIVNQNNPATGQTSITRTSAGTAPPTIGAAVRGVFTATSESGDGVQGLGSGNAGAGVFGESGSNAGYGVYGSSTTGYALYAGGNGRLGFESNSSSFPPTSGTYQTGDVFKDSGGTLWVCVVSGSGSASSWRKLAGPATSGQLHLLAVPLRAYDSRPGQAAASGGDGPLADGGERVVSLLSGRNVPAVINETAVPAGSRGALVNVAVTQTSTAGVGFLGVFANGQSWGGTASITWFGSSQTISCSTASAVDASSAIRIRCGGGSTQIVVDVVGYYR